MTCSHPGCHCQETTVQRNQKSYCSDACADADGPGGSADTPAACGCGHPGCAK